MNCDRVDPAPSTSRAIFIIVASWSVVEISNAIITLATLCTLNITIHGMDMTST